MKIKLTIAFISILATITYSQTNNFCGQYISDDTFFQTNSVGTGSNLEASVIDAKEKAISNLTELIQNDYTYSNTDLILKIIKNYSKTICQKSTMTRNRVYKTYYAIQVKKSVLEEDIQMSAQYQPKISKEASDNSLLSQNKLNELNNTSSLISYNLLKLKKEFAFESVKVYPKSYTVKNQSGKFMSEIAKEYRVRVIDINIDYYRGHESKRLLAEMRTGKVKVKKGTKLIIKGIPRRYEDKVNFIFTCNWVKDFDNNGYTFDEFQGVKKSFNSNEKFTFVSGIQTSKSDCSVNLTIYNSNSGDRVYSKVIKVTQETTIFYEELEISNFSPGIYIANINLVKDGQNLASKNENFEILTSAQPQDTEIGKDTYNVAQMEVIQGMEQIQKNASDVDENIPILNNKNDYKFALIIGNEDYSKYQTNLTNEVNVDFAINDADIFAKYCKNVLGVPEENVFLLKNAIGTEIKREVNKISKMMMYTQGKAEVIFYYAGHGIPHETTKESYLMPVDVSAVNIEDGVKLSWLYSKLTEYNSKYVLVFLDACFTGGARNQGLLAARGVKIKPKKNIISGNCIAFTSSSDIQSSLPYKEKQHGMFTYYLLKKLQESNGNITLGELSDYLYENVALSSLKVNSKEQTPKTLVSPSLKDNWKQIKLVE